MLYKKGRRDFKTRRCLNLKGKNRLVADAHMEQSRTAICNPVLRAALALAVLVHVTPTTLAFPADNIPYCSGGFDKPARIVLHDRSSMFLEEEDKPEIHFGVPQRLTLTVGDKTEVFEYPEPVEESVTTEYHPQSGSFSIIGDGGAYLAEARIDKTTVIIFADRVFWPCDE